MPDCIRYTCHVGLLPVIQQVLIDHDYAIEISPYRRFNGTMTTVLRCGATAVLLESAPSSAVGEIEVWGPGRNGVTNVLESQHFDLHKQPVLLSADNS